MFNGFDINYENVVKLISGKQSVERFNHTMSVVQISKELALKNSLNVEKAQMAALLHDLYKEMPLKYQLKLAKRWNLIKYTEDQLVPSVLHGPLAAYWLEHYWLFKDQEILNAISRHTLGYPDMSKLDMVIYSSDMVEPTRKFPEVDNLRKALYYNLEEGTLACLEHTLFYLRKTQRTIHPLTLQAYEDLKRRLELGTK